MSFTELQSFDKLSQKLNNGCRCDSYNNLIDVGRVLMLAMLFVLPYCKMKDLFRVRGALQEHCALMKRKIQTRSLKSIGPSKSLCLV